MNQAIEALKVAINQAKSDVEARTINARENGESESEFLNRYEAVAYCEGLLKALAIVEPLSKLYADLEAELNSEKAEYLELVEDSENPETTTQRNYLNGRISGIKYALGVIETTTGGNK